MPIDLQTLARYGADARIAELEREIAEIRNAFPKPAAGRGRRANTASGPATRSAATPRKRKPMSASAKKAVSLRMRKYWATRKSAGGAQPTAAAADTTQPAKKRTMSAEARARISAAQKKRWRAHKAAKKS